MKISMLCCAGVALAFSLLSFEASAQSRPVAKPNVILVLADDLGAAELGCYGNRIHQTPNLDRMAAEGLRLDTFYATPLCTPSRVCLMTGQYGFRTGYLGMDNQAFIPPPGSPLRQIGERFTIGDLMKSAGYATALSGKWQLSGEIPTLIHDCGFDEYRMWAYSHNLPKGVEHTGRWESGTQRTTTARYWNPSIVENGKYLPTKENDYGPDLFMDFIVDFIRRHKHEPFFVYHTSVLTHNPHEETPDPEHPGKRLPKGFQSNVEHLDHLMGRLRRTLGETKLASNTVLIFIGDNGTGRRGKGTVTELGARVPCIMWGPEWVRPRPDATGALGDLADIMPTLAGLSGADLPKDRTFDGQSMVPLLRGETSRGRDWIYSFLDDGRLLRSDRWLLVIPPRGDRPSFFDCGESRDGSGYRRVRTDDDPEAEAARERFARILAGMPEPKPRPGASQPAQRRSRQRDRRR